MSLTGCISIVIPTRNGAATLPAVLDAIAGQQIDIGVRIVAVDSGSTDGTLPILKERADRLIQVPPKDFDHGLTRNLAIKACDSELVVLLVQDAVPASATWLRELTAPFSGEPSLAGTFARQLPRPDASRLTRWSLSRWVAAQPEPRISRFRDTDLDGMQPMQRYLACVFDNVCSCVRRAVWAEIPFRSTTIAEDVEWGRDVLLAGHSLAYVPQAAVIHSHERSLRYELGRTYLVHRRLYELFGLRTIPGPGHLLRSMLATLADHRRCLAAGDGPRPGPAEMARTMALALVWPLGQYLGGLAGARGWHLLGGRGL